MKRTVVKKLVIELAGRDVELTMEQARELQASLNELFGEKVREIVRDPVYIREPYVWPRPQPFWLAASGTKFSLTDSTVRCSLKAG